MYQNDINFKTDCEAEKARDDIYHLCKKRGKVCIYLSIFTYV